MDLRRKVMVRAMVKVWAMGRQPDSSLGFQLRSLSGVRTNDRYRKVMVMIGVRKVMVKVRVSISHGQGQGQYKSWSR